MKRKKIVLLTFQHSTRNRSKGLFCDKKYDSVETFIATKMTENDNMIVGIMDLTNSSPNTKGIRKNESKDKRAHKEKTSVVCTLDACKTNLIASFFLSSLAAPNSKTFIALGIEFNPLKAVWATE